VKVKVVSVISVIVILLTSYSQHVFAQKSVTYIEVVKQASTGISVTSTDNPIAPGQSVQIIASVTPLKPSVPTGSVSFTATGVNTGSSLTSGPLPLGSTGVSSWNPAFSVADQFNIVATYSGDKNYQASSSTGFAENVAWPGSPDFSVGLPQSITVVAGRSVSSAITVTPKNGFTGTVEFTCNGAPDNSTCAFANGSVVVPAVGLTTASLSAQSPVSTTFTVTTAATTVTTVGAFVLLFGLFRPRRRRQVIFATSVLGLIFVALLISGCAGSNRYIQSNGTPLGTYELTIVAKSGTITHTANVTLNVVAK